MVGSPFCGMLSSIGVTESISHLGERLEAANNPRYIRCVLSDEPPILGISEGILPVTARHFLTLADVADILNISISQTRALVRSGELPAIQIGGRGQWRIERSVLEDYIAEGYRKTAELIHHRDDVV